MVLVLKCLITKDMCENFSHYSTVDYMLLMTYNYHGQWENTTGHHGGLYPNNLDRSAKERALCVVSVWFFLEIISLTCEKPLLGNYVHQRV